MRCRRNVAIRPIRVPPDPGANRIGKPAPRLSDVDIRDPDGINRMTCDRSHRARRPARGSIVDRPIDRLRRTVSDIVCRMASARSRAVPSKAGRCSGNLSRRRMVI
jgi:hypothetical protein